MSLPREQIDYVAHLSRLALSDAERERFGSELASILAYVEKLNELDTSGVPPTVHVMGLRNVFRGDVERPSTSRDAMLAGAPARACGFYLVPKILD
ncbi:MAG TPA: Asp-tRNA(Asn)/Glu-tRNA(Gln) amidotransferase subunit GatC [Planctomycetota bacterium]|nr:Asp-tRNA(Asn)/Glu-tRNA(Gln) amidotransferase subunit GatC [Planctomycetota bacterium]